MSSSKSVRIDDVIDVMTEKLKEGGTVTFSPHGTSMLPMLRDGEDVVVLKGTGGKRLHLFDVPLYRRDNGQYVLHRVLDFCRDGSYVMCGDNQFVKEKGKGIHDAVASLPAIHQFLVLYPTVQAFLPLRKKKGFRAGRQDKEEKK